MMDSVHEKLDMSPQQGDSPQGDLQAGLRALWHLGT